MKRGICLVFIFILLSAFVLAQDEDNDGYCVEKDQCPEHPNELDCNDNNPLINPGMSEGYVADDLDNDCNGIIDDINIECVDSDLDGFNLIIQGNEEVCGPEDCDDSRADINPGLTEICDDNIDNDCDAKIDSDDEDCISEESGSNNNGASSNNGGSSESFGGSQQSFTEILNECNLDKISVSCLSVEWSDCDPLTKKQTRDVSKCDVKGTSDQDCIKTVLSSVTSERPCSVSTPESEEVSATTGYCGDNVCDDTEDRIICPDDCTKNVCGDGYCDFDEDEVNCKEDCAEKSSFGWVIFLIIVLLAVTGSIIGYYLKKKKNVSKKIFANQKDLNALIDFIKKAKARKMSDAQIKNLLLQHKWKKEQVELAFTKLKTAGKKTVNETQKST